MNCYVIFKRWLFPSLLFRCHRSKTPLNTKNNICDLNYRLGFFPSRHKTLSHYVRLFIFKFMYSKFENLPYNCSPNKLSGLYHIKFKLNAILKYFSRKTSYIRARLAFHLYSKVLREYCNNHRFVPPLTIFVSFKLLLNRSHGFGSYIIMLTLLKLAFATAFALHNNITRKSIIPKVRCHFFNSSCY